MPVSAIFENREAGASVDDIIERFDRLNREQVKAVIEFAARSLDSSPPVRVNDVEILNEAGPTAIRPASTRRSAGPWPQERSGNVPVASGRTAISGRPVQTKCANQWRGLMRCSSA